MTTAYLNHIIDNRPKFAVDITGFGIHATVDDPDVDLPLEKVDLLRLAVLARGCQEAGADLVSFGASFRLRTPRGVISDELFDPVVATRQLAAHVGSCGITAGIEINSYADLQKAVGILSSTVVSDGGYLAVTVDGPTGKTLQTVCNTIANIRIPAGHVKPKLVLCIRSAEDVELAGKYADVVRIRTSNFEVAKILRERIVQSASQAGRKTAPPLLVDLRFAVGTDEAALEAREILLSVLDGDNPHWRGAAIVTGSPLEIVSKAEKWLDVCDGLVFIPTSVEGDLAHVIREILPVFVRGNYDLLIQRPAVVEIPSIAAAI